MKRLIWTLPLAVLGACSSLTPTDDPIYLRLNDIEARLMRMERVFDNQSLIELSSQVEELRSELQDLRGQLETLQHDTESQAERQRDLYLDVDERLQALEQSQAVAGGGSSSSPAAAGGPNGGASGASGSSSTTGAAASASGSAQDRYDRAFGLIQARQYEQAATAFREFLESFPNSDYASNAQYWLAETFYVRSQFSEALPEFQRVLDDYPRSSKIPDALLKVGYCNYELENFDAARTALRRVQTEFPDTTAARLAGQRLDQIAREAG